MSASDNGTAYPCHGCGTKLDSDKDGIHFHGLPLQAFCSACNPLRYEEDRREMFRAADGSVMCESHPGYEFGACPGGPMCGGPGMPWILDGRTMIEEVLASMGAVNLYERSLIRKG